MSAEEGVIVYGFACRSFLESRCTIEFTRLTEGVFSTQPKDRVRGVTGEKNIYSFQNPDSRRNFAYYAHRAAPGTYALRRFTAVANNILSVFTVTDAHTDRPYAPFQVDAGKVHYLGDFTFYTTPFKEEVPVERDENPAAMAAFLKDFPNLPAERVTRVIDFGP
ncbi:hypothetical protein [Elstera litoralis]|uniref:hypothetical protein n=1 Tax=Elstera litoralis TaxID=552518 RepID=UPI0012ED57F9|nr:hypothetical protein [Elstera litoralis]